MIAAVLGAQALLKIDQSKRKFNRDSQSSILQCHCTKAPIYCTIADDLKVYACGTVIEFRSGFSGMVYIKYNLFDVTERDAVMCRCGGGILK